jgi:RNA polymerase sigma-70 factor (ECF subfamily)
LTPEVFAEHYRQHLPAIAKFLARRVDTSEVEDLCSDVFMKAYEKKHLAPAGYELAWLYSIAGHLVANHRRKQNTVGRLVTALSIATYAPSAESLAVADLSLSQAWRKLKPAEQNLLALVALDGTSVTEAAKILGISPNAASVRLNRARTKLSGFMEVSE